MEALALVAPEEIGALPTECRHLAVDRRRDVHHAAVVLLKYRGGNETGGVVRQLAELFRLGLGTSVSDEHRRFPA